MTYKPSKLSVLAYANGFTLWHYKSDTTITKTKANDFWTGDANKTLRNQDVVLATCTDGIAIMLVSNSGDSFVPAKKIVKSGS